MQINRSTPDEALAVVNAEESSVHPKGNLKIFFGYAAGVGKTYAMLKEALVAKHRDIDVVIGYLEPHDRPQTARLGRGLEHIDYLDIEYRDLTLHEFNLDAALARKPELIVVDELAHTNAEGCRHAKRYQDVEELLEAGIDVYTTLNVQHIESLNNVVASITGILVHERIPDHIFDDAQKIELIDIEPDDLMRRLKEGKVYKTGKAEYAMGHFFSPENLAALREMAMRRTADQVNKKAKAKRSEHRGSYFSDEHILVCFTSDPLDQRTIRTASHLASAFFADFSAIVLEEDNHKNTDSRGLRANIKLAEQLGANVNTMSGNDIVGQVAEFARLSSVSKIVIGKKIDKQRVFARRSAFARHLEKAAPDIDLVILSEAVPKTRKTVRSASNGLRLSWKDALKSISLLIAATLLGLVFESAHFSVANIIMTYLLAVLIIAIVTQRRIYSLVSSVLSVLMFNYFFTEPHFSFAAYDAGYPMTFAIMFVSAFITSSVASKLKREGRRSTKRAYETNILLTTSRLLQQAHNENEIILICATQIVKLLSKSVIIYPARSESLTAPRIFILDQTVKDEVLEVPLTELIPNGISSPPAAVPSHYKSRSKMIEMIIPCLSEKESAVATWVFKNNQHAGFGTGTLNDARCLYLAIRGVDTVCGVIGIVMDDASLDSDQNNLCLAVLNECGLVIERNLLRKREALATAKARAEEMRANLLQSISHDLRTPLTAITGNASMLLKNRADLDESQYQKLCFGIYDDSMWLTNLVENLLAITRIERDGTGINLQPEIVADAIDEAIRHVDRKSYEHTIVVEDIDEFMMARMDTRLIVQVIVNLVNNAIEYTHKGSRIVVTARLKSPFVEISASDTGEGIPDQDKLKIFDMFYSRNLPDKRRGTGFGLFFCKTIVEAHCGTIMVEDNSPEGTVFKFTLPAKENTFDG